MTRVRAVKEFPSQARITVRPIDHDHVAVEVTAPGVNTVGLDVLITRDALRTHVRQCLELLKDAA